MSDQQHKTTWQESVKNLFFWTTPKQRSEVVTCDLRDERGRAQLQQAVARLDMPMIKKLLGKKNLKSSRNSTSKMVDVDAQDNEGLTALHILASQDFDRDHFQELQSRISLHELNVKYRMEAFRLLLKADANVNLTTKYGKNVLHFAAELNDIAMVTVLVMIGTDADIKDQSGNSPLHTAVLALSPTHVTGTLRFTEDAYLNAGLFPIIAKIARASKNIDSLNDEGLSALHIAASRNDRDAVHQLLLNAANPEIKDGTDRQAKDLTTDDYIISLLNGDI